MRRRRRRDRAVHVPGVRRDRTPLERESAKSPDKRTVNGETQWSLAVHWEEQRAGEDSETHIQIHRDDLAPGSRLREQTCAPLL
ncbi:hypothetical protein E5288_WYG014225 [Bos mutus]|uniref:Uncharacterized protein n=1 Tax=Bos mutus TaxID=72004 RepID=A0A6B0R2D6_9CETA|nr:hypothetical protein [Bos mutus]